MNNDVEGWHNRLNHRSRRGQLDIYQLAPLLHQEAEFVSVQASLVSDAKLRRHQRKEWESWNFCSMLYSLVEVPQLELSLPAAYFPSILNSLAKYQGAKVPGC